VTALKRKTWNIYTLVTILLRTTVRVIDCTFLLLSLQIWPSGISKSDAMKAAATVITPIILGKLTHALNSKRAERQNALSQVANRDRIALLEARQRRQLQQDTIAYAERERRRLERIERSKHVSRLQQQEKMRQFHIERAQSELRQRLLQLQTREATRGQGNTPSREKYQTLDGAPTYYVLNPSNPDCASETITKDDKLHYSGDGPLDKASCQRGPCTSCR
jgi:hypothetical protein